MSPYFHSCPLSDFFCNRCGEDVAYSSLYLVQSAVSVHAVPFASTLASPACLKKLKTLVFVSTVGVIHAER